HRPPSIVTAPSPSGRRTARGLRAASTGPARSPRSLIPAASPRRSVELGGSYVLLPQTPPPDPSPHGHHGRFPPGLSVEAHDLDPVAALAGRVLREVAEGAAAAVDRVDRDRLRLLAAHHHVAAPRIDAEPARLLLGRRAREIGQLAGGAVHAERPDRAA